MNEVWITTTDNPFDPFKDPDNWRSFDVDKGYFTREYVARIAKTNSEMTDQDYNNEVERAIDEIIKFNPLKIYKKVYKTQEKQLET